FGSVEVMATVSLVLTTFQFTSTAFTVMVKATPAVWPMGAPVFPLIEPGPALSPGTRICNLAKVPGLTVIAGLVLAALVPSDRSVAVKVVLPAVIRVTLNDCVPAFSEALEGIVALASVEVIPMESVALETRFQLASTALTVTLNGTPELRAVGVPVL